MKTRKILCISLILSLFVFACQDNDIDKTKPNIDMNFEDAFPLNCDTLYFGESFSFNMLFSDNVELGSYSIDIHHNFDHHSHSTEVNECDLDSVKKAVNPFVFIHDYPIPEGKNEYKTNLSMYIPSENNNGLYDEGDYHFFVSLTDKEGWSTQKGLSIKILYRTKE